MRRPWPQVDIGPAETKGLALAEPKARVADHRGRVISAGGRVQDTSGVHDGEGLHLGRVVSRRLREAYRVLGQVAPIDGGVERR